MRVEEAAARVESHHEASPNVLTASGSFAAKGAKGGTTPGTVSFLYTMGMPSVSREVIRNLAPNSGGCFPGLRLYTANPTLGTFDPVAVVNQLVGFEHLETPTLALYTAAASGEGVVVDCDVHDDVEDDPHPDGWGPGDLLNVALEMHESTTYMTVAEEGRDRTGSHQAMWATVLNSISLMASAHLYMPALRQTAQSHGLRLVARVYIEVGTAMTQGNVAGDSCGLMQNPTDLSCVLNWRGSDSLDDFINYNLNIFHTTFCGFPSVHRGFVDLLRLMAEHDEYQQMRTMLPKCSSVTANGWSLGGALASLWTACANSGRTGDSDFELIGWTSGTPELIDALPDGYCQGDHDCSDGHLCSNNQCVEDGACASSSDCGYQDGARRLCIWDQCSSATLYPNEHPVDDASLCQSGLESCGVCRPAGGLPAGFDCAWNEDCSGQCGKWWYVCTFCNCHCRS